MKFLRYYLLFLTVGFSINCIASSSISSEINKYKIQFTDTLTKQNNIPNQSPKAILKDSENLKLYSICSLILTIMIPYIGWIAPLLLRKRIDALFLRLLSAPTLDEKAYKNYRVAKNINAASLAYFLVIGGLFALYIGFYLLIILAGI